jgi:Flp pilus assembly secretin CpaC
MISLEIAVEDSSARDKTGSGGNVLLAVDKKSMDTYLDVLDGHTVAIGGIIERSGSKGKNGIPILMDIPMLGRAFRTENKKSIKRKLLIFITPHIEKMGGPKESEESVDLGLGEESLGSAFDWTEEDMGYYPPQMPEEGAETETIPEEGVIRYGPATPTSGEVIAPSDAIIPSGTNEAVQ